MHYKSLLPGIAVIAALLTGCVTYHGRVIDAETKQPIEGAVVVASWLEEQGSFAGGVSRLDDVKETLTDKNGEWSIRGPRGTRSDCMSNCFNILTFVSGTHYTLPPEFIVFKPGYCSYPKGYGINACKGKLKSFNFGNSKFIGEMLELPKITSREDRRKNMPSRIQNTGTMNNKELIRKQKILIRLLKDEDEFLYPGYQEKSMYEELLRELNDER